MSRKILAYIAAPFTASTPEGIQSNVDYALQLAAEVNDAGNSEVFAVVPHPMGFAVNKRMKSKPPESFWYEGDIKLMKHCDVVVVGKGWKSSFGCCNEIDIAQSLEIPVIFHEIAVKTTVENIFCWLKKKDKETMT